MLIDTHTHLSDSKFDSDRHEVISRAFDAGVEKIVEIADRDTEWEKARILSEAYPEKIYWTAGFHPHYADVFTEEVIQKMLQTLQHPSCVALGEIGLDYVKSEVSSDIQQKVFRRCLEIASEAGKPVVIHCRQAQLDVLRILRSFYRGLSHEGVIQGVIHCFQGDRLFAEGCLELGFLLGINGPITYPNAQSLREVIKNVSLENLVLETDCPYLPPQSHRGQKNEPSYLTEVTDKVAELLSVSPQTVIEETSRAAKKLYHI